MSNDLIKLNTLVESLVHATDGEYVWLDQTCGEAADLIESQAKEIESLREKLHNALNNYGLPKDTDQDAGPDHIPYVPPTALKRESR
jgi:hypothetical protein